MSKSVNQVTLIGNIGKDPEIRTLDNGVKVATFSLATSTGGFKKQDGTDVPEKTSWHNVVCWRGLADLAEKFVKKGDKLTVFGSISYREYEKDGVKRYATDIIAYDLVLMGKSEQVSTRPPQLSEADIPEDFPPMPPSDGLPW
mgnify:FL=1